MADNPTPTLTRPKRRRRSKLVPRIVAGCSAALLLTAAVLGYRAAAEPAQARYRTAVAGSGTVAQTISLSGSVHHVSQVSVTFPTAGMVVSVFAKPGDTVAAGQPLAAIDGGPLQNAVLDAEAAWRAAVSKLDTDQTAYDNAQSSATAAATSGSSKGATSAPKAQGSSSAPGEATGAPSASGSRPPSGTPTTGGPATGRPSGSASGPATSASGPATTTVRPTAGGSSVPATATVEDAAKAIAALQQTLDSLQPNLDAFVTQCLPSGLPSTAPSGLPSAVPSVVTVTATRTVTATTTVTANPNQAEARGGSATASGAPAPGPATTTPTSAAATSKSASGTPANERPLAPGPSVSPACQQAVAALAAMPQTLREQLAAVQSTLVGAQASLTAQAAALQAQAQELSKQGAAMQQQAAALQQQAAALQAQADALKAQGAAMSAQGAAAAAKLGAGGMANVSEATLITDRANVASTALALQQAKDRLVNATVTSPIAGTVASMPWVAGQSTTASSAAIVIGPGAIEITVPVALAQRPQVEVGQTATITSPVSSQQLDGKVTRIGLLPISSAAGTGTQLQAAAAAGAAGAAAAAGSTSSTVSYPVVVTVPSLGDALPEGSRVQVGIVTAKVDAPVVVPASAVTPTSATSGTLEVFANGSAERRVVQIGISGGGVTQILSGVAAGETVVVADMELPLPGVTINTGRPSQQAQQGGQFQPGEGRQTGQGGQFQPGQSQPTR